MRHLNADQHSLDIDSSLFEYIASNSRIPRLLTQALVRGVRVHVISSHASDGGEY